jgi:lipopolysaccharide transport system ATP-binding protein
LSLPAIHVGNLSKLYHIGRHQERLDTLRDALAYTLHRIGNSAKRGRLDEADRIWALKDVSFEVYPGEVLGVIGRNGAGKSTLLKILSRITEPTSGRAVINGRVGSLLEVGTGFHPELTGRENIYLNGAILGMMRKEIDKKFDEIVSFSEIERFLDTPVKRYSSGMYVRLAFAVAAHLEPEVLIIDEVISVGDIAFQKKCLDKMESASKTGRAVVFVSHNMQAIADLCSTVLFLEQGATYARGKPAEIIQLYLKQKQITIDGFKCRQSTNFLLNQVLILGRNLGRIIPGDELSIEVYTTSLIPASDLSIHIDILDQNHTRIMGFDSVDFGVIVEPVINEVNQFKLKILRCPLPPGKYTLDIYLKIYSQFIYEYFDSVTEFEVEQIPVYGNRLYDPRWHGKIITQATMTAEAFGLKKEP